MSTFQVTRRSDVEDSTKPADGALESTQLDAASARTFKVPELLDEILSYLLASDLMAAHDVNDTFQASVVRAPDPKKTLFLGPPGKVPQIWLNEQLEVVKLGGSKPAGAIQPVELCPLLELRNDFKMKAGQRMQTQWNTEFARFTMQLAKMKELGDMVLTDPPVNRAEVYLRYTHNSGSVVLVLTCTVKQDKPLTMGVLLDSAGGARGSLYVEENISTNPSRPSIRVGSKDNTTLLAEIQQQVLKRGGHFSLDIKHSRVEFKNVVAPTAQEWKDIGLEK